MKRLDSLACIVLSIAAGLVACRPAEPTGAGEWPRFRGPAGSGLSTAEALPQTWSEASPNILWKSRIPGQGNSSPIVSHGLVILTTGQFAGRQVERSVVALDFETGGLLWQTVIHTGSQERKHRFNTYAAPSPATDGTRIFAHFGDVLACLDREGRIQWTAQTDPDYTEYAHYGAASSPILTEKAVIVPQDRETLDKPIGWLAAFDKATGEEIWRTTWDRSCCSYTTPIVRQVGDREEIVYTRAGAVIAYDPGSGKELWRHHLEINQPVASPVLQDDLLVVFSGAHHVRYGAVLRLTGEGSATRTEELWTTNTMIPQTSSPVIYDGRLYTLVEQGIMVCYDLATGKRLWRKRLAGGGYQSSLVAGDGKIYAVSSAGTTVVIAARRRFKELATNTLAEGGNASPALAGDSLLIRTGSSVYRIRPEAARASA